MIGRESLKGYLLEEILARLIYNTGYRLLVDPVQDPRELARRGNGLVVKGRGAEHQADVLGQLNWIPAFTYPIRLFVEAKSGRSKVGIPVVRNALGVLDDLNQNYSTVGEGRALVQRYNYRYALFSTSGFTAAASDMALAHQISLIDLSGPDFNDLRNLLEDLANVILQKKQSTGEITSALDKDIEKYPYKHHGLSKMLRVHIRELLKTWPEGIQTPPDYYNFSANNKMFSFESFGKILLSGVERIGEFFVAMSNGPFMLILKPENVNKFLDFIEGNTVHEIKVSWSRPEGKERHCFITPLYEQQAYKTTFGLPGAFADWIFTGQERVNGRALSFRQNYSSEITIYRFVCDEHKLYRLIYNMNEGRECKN